jgi:hypothetical protein
VNVDGLKGMLLSPLSRKYSNGYATCACCYKGMCPNWANKRTPPKFAIANGFAIGFFPQKIVLLIRMAREKPGTSTTMS